MKYLIVLAVIAVVYALWRSQRQVPPNRGSAPRQNPAQPQDMVCCAHCGVHLPKGEALHQGGHSYCSRAPLSVLGAIQRAHARCKTRIEALYRQRDAGPQ